jgi:hypothetical protein
MLAIAFLLKKSCETTSCVMVCFSQFAMAGTGSCSCMASGMSVAAAASELKKSID